MSIKKIVIIGPESTGKSTLCKQLAVHFKTRWVQEYAREFLSTNGKEYLFSDLYKIAEGQLKNEDDATINTPNHEGNIQSLFVDTDMYVIKVWSEFVFNKCDNRILNTIASRQYDLYLLCNTDLPWQEDDFREYPDRKTREKLFHFYKDAMINQQVPWVIISGQYEERIIQAIHAVENLIY